jgi:hypothetical protein
MNTRTVAVASIAAVVRIVAHIEEEGVSHILKCVEGAVRAGKPGNKTVHI